MYPWIAIFTPHIIWIWIYLLNKWINYNCIKLISKTKESNLPGFEPGIFWSVVRRVIHCATSPYVEVHWVRKSQRAIEHDVHWNTTMVSGLMHVCLTVISGPYTSEYTRVGGRTRTPSRGRFTGSTTASLWLVKVPSRRYTSTIASDVFVYSVLPNREFTLLF